MTHQSNNSQYYSEHDDPLNFDDANMNPSQQQQEPDQRFNFLDGISSADEFTDYGRAASNNGFVKSVSTQANFVGPSDAVLTEILKKLDEIGTSIANLDQRLQNLEGQQQQQIQPNTQQAFSMSLIGIRDGSSPKQTLIDNVDAASTKDIQISILNFQLKALIDGGAKLTSSQGML
jgi:hypothetical protein